MLKEDKEREGRVAACVRAKLFLRNLCSDPWENGGIETQGKGDEVSGNHILMGTFRNLNEQRG